MRTMYGEKIEKDENKSGFSILRKGIFLWHINKL